jgi:hypothetical protein
LSAQERSSTGRPPTSRDCRSRSNSSSRPTICQGNISSFSRRSPTCTAGKHNAVAWLSRGSLQDPVDYDRSHGPGAGLRAAGLRRAEKPLKAQVAAFIPSMTGVTKMSKSVNKVILVGHVGKVSQVSQLYVEGKLRTTSWEDRQSGERKYRTEIVARDLVLLGSRDKSGNGAQPSGSEKREKDKITDPPSPDLLTSQMMRSRFRHSFRCPNHGGSRVLFPRYSAFRGCPRSLFER